MSKTPDGKSIDAASALAPLGDSLTRPLRDLRIERLVRAFVCLGVAKVGPDRSHDLHLIPAPCVRKHKTPREGSFSWLLDPIETFEHFVTINRQGPGR